VTATGALVAVLPAASVAFATTWCSPFGKPLVETVSFQVPSAAFFAVPIRVLPVQKIRDVVSASATATRVTVPTTVLPAVGLVMREDGAAVSRAGVGVGVRVGVGDAVAV
jgi:hypothetical protein